MAAFSRSSSAPAPEDTPGARGHLLTEQRLPSSAAVDALSVEAALRLINTQDMDVPRAVRDAIPQITAFVEAAVERFRPRKRSRAPEGPPDTSAGYASAHEPGGRLIYLGAGTSGRLGVLDASECPPTFHCDPSEVVGLIAGGDSALRRSSEGMEDDSAGAHAELQRLQVNPNDLVLGIAAGGTTPYVWGALKWCNARNVATGLLTCVPLSSVRSRPRRAPVVKPNEPLAPPDPPRLPARVDFPIELLVGPEVITGSTRMKAGTATKLALNMISTTLMLQMGKAWGNLMIDLKATNAKLRDRALRILTSQTDLTRDQATTVLELADGSVKTALVMARLTVGPEEARRLIEKHDGKLRPLLGPPR